MGTVYLFVALLFVNIFSFLAAGSCDTQCTWTPWSSWSDCDRRCAGGTQIRSRGFCCKLSLAHDSRLCMADCGMDYDQERSGYHDSRGCNQVCHNGGTFVNTYYSHCSCPDRYRGTCCQDEVTCGRPSTISHGNFSGSDFTYAGKVEYTCNGTYNMTNPSQSIRTCTKNGYWTGSAPTCVNATSCNSNPCQNGANCENLLGDYRCDCTSGWTGKNCETDIQPPVIEGCPADRNIVTSDLTSRQVWSEPNITDPHGTEVNISKNYQTSSFEFPWGEFTVQYAAVKTSNGLKAECKFNISVKPYPCKDMDPPVNGIILCNGWRREYSHICAFACKQNYTLPPGYKADDIYVCGATGHWLPVVPVPRCVTEKMFPTNQVGKVSSCTKSDDRRDLAEFYVDFLRKSAMNALCEQHVDDCKPENVDIKC